MRKLRYVPKPKTLVHITCRTIQGLYLFRPGPESNDVFLGVLGTAQGINGLLRWPILGWPGVHCFGARIDGTPMTGHWFDRSQEHAARVRGEEYSRFEYATTRPWSSPRFPAGLISPTKPTVNASLP